MAETGTPVETLGLRLDASGMVTGGKESERALQGVTTAAEATERKVLGLSGVLRASADTIGASARSISSDLAHLGTGFIEAFAGFEALHKFVEKTSEAQFAVAQLEAAVKSTGEAAGRSVEQLEDLANATQKISIYDHDAIEGAESLFLAFDKIQGVNFDRAVKDAADLATRMKGDLQGAAIQLGKALQDPEQGLLALRRAGVVFTESQQAVIKELYGTGQAAAAQTLILDEIERKFGGSAAAAKDTLGGALRSLKNDFGDLFEASKDSTSGIVEGLKAVDSTLVALKPHMGEVITILEVLAAGFALKTITSGVTLLVQWAGALRLSAAAALEFATAQTAAARSNVVVAEASVAATSQAVILADAQLAAAEADVVSATQAVALARAQIAASEATAARIIAVDALTAADARLVAAEAAQVAALTATTGAARVAAGAVGLLEKALALVGGPVGAAVIAAFLVIRYAFDQEGKAARDAQTDLEKYTASLSKMTAEQIRAADAVLQLKLQQADYQRNALTTQVGREIKAVQSGEGGSVNTVESNERAKQISELTALIAHYNDQINANHERLKQTGEDSTTLAGKVTLLIDARKRELASLVALNGAYGESDLALKRLEIAQAGVEKTTKDLEEIKKLGLGAAEYAAAKKSVEELNAALVAQQIIQAKNAVTKAQVIDAAAYTAANAALVQATANETTLAAATDKASLAQQQGAATVAHLFATIDAGSRSTESYLASSRAAAAADIAAGAAARERAAANERLKIGLEAQTAATAAYVTFQKEANESINASNDRDVLSQLNAAAAKEAATNRTILQQRFLKDSAVQTSQAFQAQADVIRRAAADTAFRDSLNETNAATKRDTAAILEEVEAHKQGQAAIDALHVSRAADAAIIEVQTKAKKDGVIASQDEIDAAVATATAHEKASIALAHATDQYKLAQQPIENFIKATQQDVGNFFVDLFKSGGTAVENFWHAFRDLAIKTFAEIASLKLFEGIIGEGGKGGIAGSLVRALGIGGASFAAALPLQTRADGTRLAPGSGIQPIAGTSAIGTGLGGLAALGAGFGAGYGIGTSSPNAATGAVGGAAAGAATGAVIGSVVPGIGTAVGAVLGATAGLVGGLLGHAKAAKEAAEAEKQVRESYALSIATYRQLAGTGDALTVALAKNKSDADALRDSVEKGYAGTKNETEREQKLAEINKLEAIRNAQLVVEIATKQREAIEDYDVRTLRATGLAAEGDALAFAETQQREYSKAVTEGATATQLAALSLTQAAEAARHAQDITDDATQQYFALAARRIAATGGTDRQVEDAQRAAQQTKELADARKNGTQEEVDALNELQNLENAKREADRVAANLQLQEDYKVRQLQAEGHTAEAAALALADTQRREYEAAVKAGLDDATLAALALAQAAESAAAAAKQAQAAQRALDDLQVRSLAAQGDTTGADQLRFQLQQQRELEDAIAGGQSQDYIDKLKDVQRLEAQARAADAAQKATGALSNVAANQPSNETSAISSAARTITETTGNRMADYLASILLVEKQIRDAVVDNAGPKTPSIVTAAIAALPLVAPAAASIVNNVATTNTTSSAHDFSNTASTTNAPDFSTSSTESTSIVHQVINDLLHSIATDLSHTIANTATSNVVNTLAPTPEPIDTSSLDARPTGRAQVAIAPTAATSGTTVNRKVEIAITLKIDPITGATIPRAQLEGLAKQLKTFLDREFYNDAVESQIVAGDTLVSGV